MLSSRAQQQSCSKPESDPHYLGLCRRRTLVSCSLSGIRPKSEKERFLPAAPVQPPVGLRLNQPRASAYGLHKRLGKENTVVQALDNQWTKLVKLQNNCEQS